MKIIQDADHNHIDGDWNDGLIAEKVQNPWLRYLIIMFFGACIFLLGFYGQELYFEVIGSLLFLIGLLTPIFTAIFKLFNWQNQKIDHKKIIWLVLLATVSIVAIMIIIMEMLGIK